MLKEERTMPARGRLCERRRQFCAAGVCLREDGTVSLGLVDVRRAIEAMLGRVPDTKFRLVGTASCVLRGIEMPASDIDVLFHERDAIDAWVASLGDVVQVNEAPIWLADVSQYFARLTIQGATVELSTVEIPACTDTAECVGSGPWVHFDLVRCGESAVPTVALELRLVTEVARHRTDRWEPIVAYFRSHPCDVALVERGLVAHSAPPDEIRAVIGSLSVG
jgi:hypothetical protein